MKIVEMAYDDYPQIEWERRDFEQSHDYIREYFCTGVDTTGGEWSGTWSEYKDGHIEITNQEMT